MREQLVELLNTLYEAEGLIDMALRRKVDSSDRVVRLAVEKCRQIGRIASDVQLPEVQESENFPEELPVYGYASECSDDASDVSDAKTCGAINEKEVDIFTSEVLPRFVSDIEEDKNDESVESSVSETDSDATDSAANSEDEGIPDDEDDVMDKDEDTEEVVIESHSNQVTFEQSEESVESVSAAEIKPEPEVKQHIKAVKKDFSGTTKPLIKSFSINDKFRFRRALFSGSDIEFREVLAMLESFSDYEQARGYCFTSFDWEPDTEDVKAFLKILENYYK